MEYWLYADAHNIMYLESVDMDKQKNWYAQ